MRLFFYTFQLLPFATLAQSVQGVVTDAGNHKPLSPVTVVNVVTQQVSYTDLTGHYTIAAKPGERVAFSYLGYNTVEKFCNVAAGMAGMNVALERKLYELDAVVFRPGKLSQYQLDSINRAETYRLPLARTAPSMMSPISAIAELFSKKAKRLYLFQKDFATGEVQKYIDSRYSRELVTSLTGLKGDSLSDFMYVYRMPYDYARVASPLELKMWVRDNYKTWIKTYVDTTIKTAPIVPAKK